MKRGTSRVVPMFCRGVESECRAGTRGRGMRVIAGNASTGRGNHGRGRRVLCEGSRWMACDGDAVTLQTSSRMPA
jgi:hypothetical protein